MGLNPLNCDLGEHEPAELTAALAACVGSINVACGGHAGDVASMTRCITLARQHDLRLGAHPGLTGQFGRGPVHQEPDAIARLVREQALRLQDLAGTPLHHLKLHGSLYHAAEARPELAAAVIALLAREFPSTAAVGLPHRAMAAAAAQHRVRFIPEGFLDRAYRPDGSLVDRTQPGALLGDPDETVERLAHWIRTRTVRACDGTALPLPVETWCLHGDTPGALDRARACLAWLRVLTPSRSHPQNPL